jgi:hypothetical protein
METTLVVGTIALMVGFGIPAVRSLVRSCETETGTRTMIRAALSSAQAMAQARQRYVGVRFQMHCTSTDAANPLANLLNAPQYMIFIMHDPSSSDTSLAQGFRAVPGMEPIRLPDSVGAMDLTNVTKDADLLELRQLSDATTFSIVFSPSGKLVVEDVHTQNRDSYRDVASETRLSADDVFNKIAQVNAGIGMFYQDDHPCRNTANADLGLGQESSRTSFVLYERIPFRQMFERRTPWTGYLYARSLDVLHVSPYTGELISSK